MRLRTLIRLETFNNCTKLERVRTFGVKDVVVELNIVEVEIKFADCSEPTLKVCNAGNIDQSNGKSGDESERGVSCRRIDSIQCHRRQ